MLHLEEARPPVLTRLPREAIVSLVVIAAVWELMSHLAPTLGIPQLAIPGLRRIATSLQSVTFIDVAVTLLRVIAALVISFLLALVSAVLMYHSPRLERYAYPLVRLLMAIPVISWILFAVLWFRFVEFRIAFVLVVVCGPLFLVDMLSTMKSVSKELRDMMRSFRPTPLQFLFKLLLPATMPSILTSWKVNLSLAIRVVTIAELVGAVTGIGHQLAIAQELFSVSDVFAWTLVLVMALFVLEWVLVKLESKLLRWRP